MDQIKIGFFIAQLRKQHNLTQEELGEKLGVTNKTISRWENGNYMPDIEMLQLLSKEFDVSINELLSGEKLSDEDFKKRADENIIDVSKSSAFTLEERKKDLIKKWRKDHISLFVVLGLIFVASLVVPFFLEMTWMLGFSGVIGLVEYGYQNNLMMTYVEKHLYK